MNALQNSISNDDAIVAFVTIDGRETVVTGKGISQKEKEKLPDVFNQGFYKKAYTGEAQHGYDYINYRGANSLFVYSKIGNTGAMLYTIIPENAIYSNLSMIKTAIIVIVVIACLIAFLIGLYFTNDIRIIIDKFSKSFQQVANGSLTLRLNTNRTDEFGDLANDLDKMLENIQGLVSDMANFSNRVTNAAVNVSVASSEILDAVNGIYEITKLMEQGINDQRLDIEKSYSQMSNFAEQINEAYEDTRAVDELADNTQATVRNGKDIVNELMKQVTSTAEITQDIITDIKQLQEQSKNIGTVVETINEIASTTELLSLNASIEAVRSGDSGRGFAVIAVEIRKLAEQSMNSVKSIEHMVVSIQNMTKKTSALADTANDMLKTQADSLNNTVNLFGDIDIHMDNLMSKMNHIMENMQDIMVSKDGILDLIRNIAAVSQETVASSEDVASTVGRQVTSVETLEAQSNDLKDQALELKHAIDKFII
jgi:methyl-accepting chemotaxis protein